MAALPMDSQPGEKFVYGYNTDILGVVVEKVSGLTLAEFFQKRITGPLGLVDTQFYLPPAQKDRLATVYAAKDGKIERATDAKTGQGHYVEGPRVAFAGGAGLLSTARDYGRFLQMLLNGGEIDGVRLLSPKTVELMTVNHVGSLFQRGRRLGFGLGFEVTEDVGRSGRYGSVGAFGWGGAYHTTYWVDPKEKLVALLMTQLLPGRRLRPARALPRPRLPVDRRPADGGRAGRRSPLAPPADDPPTPARTSADPASSRGRSGSSKSSAPTATATIGMRYDISARRVAGRFASSQ